MWAEYCPYITINVIFKFHKKDWVGAAIISDGYHRVKYTDTNAMKISN